MSTFRFLVKFLTGTPIGPVGASNGCAVPSRGLLPGTAAAHRLGTFALPGGTDMRSTFALLLCGPSLGLLFLGPA